jgi:AcrR family transcriptional regulator
MPSQKSSAAAKPRAPQRERGRARVAALLAASTAVIAESGYEAATMTEIAARAGASIGSLYQFFPTKELIADALHRENGEDLARMLADLGARFAGKPSAALADALFADLSTFLDSHPAFIALAGRRNIDVKRKKQMRRLLRGQLAALLAQAEPPVPAKRAEILAVIVLHVIQSAVTIAGEADLPNRAAVLDELRLMLRRHMAAA